MLSTKYNRIPFLNGNMVSTDLKIFALAQTFESLQINCRTGWVVNKSGITLKKASQ